MPDGPVRVAALQRRLRPQLVLLAAAAAVGAVSGASGRWALSLTVFVAIVAVGVVAVRRPVIGLALLTAGWLTGGLQEHLVDVADLLVWRDLLLVALLLRTVASQRLHRGLRVPFAVTLLWAGHLLLLTTFRELPLPALLHGARLLFTPPAVLFVAAAWLTRRDLVRLLTWLTPVLVVGTGLAVWQALSGAEALMAAGYEYGTTVRHAGGFVRAFGPLDHGLMYGHAMAVLVIGYGAVLWTPNGRAGLTRAQQVVLAGGMGMAATGLALSLTRTAVLAAVIAILAVLAVATTRGDRARAVTFCMVLFLGLTAVVSVRGSTMFTRLLDGQDASLTARIDTWTALGADRDADLVVGSGPGTAGAVAQIVDSGVDLPTVTDSFYVAVLVQYGLLGLVALAALVGWVLVGLPPARVRSSAAAAAAWGVLAYLVVAMTTYNLWEEPAAAVPAFLLLGAGLAGPDDTTGAVAAPGARDPVTA